MNKGAMTPAHLYAHTDRPEWKAAGRQWQGIPAIERTAKGRLYACWYSGGKTEEPGNIIVVEKSDDDGKTWSDGFYTVAHDDGEVRCFDPALWIDPKGRLWLFWTQSWMKYDNRDGVWAAICDDPDAENVVFGAPRRLMNGLMLNKPIVTKKGEWLFPAALWSRSFEKAFEDHPELRDEELANVYASLDAGETFERR
ncbi:MAG: sialidase family protein, partial [Clostridiales bacterium]|nr:sialidase family protein [Clostridiales bacterium]